MTVILHFAMPREAPSLEWGAPMPDVRQELHFDVRVHRFVYSQRISYGHAPADRVYLEPVPCQPCSWEEILRACTVLDLLRHEQDWRTRL